MNKYYLGLDVGASKIAAGLITGEKVIKLVKVPTQAKANKTKVLANINQVIGQVFSKNVKGIGIGVAGQINQKKGVIVSSPNFSKSFSNINLAKSISQKFKRPVKVDNDANCFALAEAVYGAGKNYQYVIGLTLGTGIGGGIVINKKIYPGKAGFAGELGHITIVKGGRKCSCGQLGHLEAYASVTSLIKIYRQLAKKKISGYNLIELINKKDKIALRIVKMGSEMLAEGLANIINIFNPEIIILGGGLSKAKPFIDSAIKLARTKVVYKQLAKTKVVKAKLGDWAGILGATLLFRK